MLGPEFCIATALSTYCCRPVRRRTCSRVRHFRFLRIATLDHEVRHDAMKRQAVANLLRASVTKLLTLFGANSGAGHKTMFPWPWWIVAW